MRNPDLLEQSIITNLIFFTMGCKIKIMEEIISGESQGETVRRNALMCL